MNKEVEIQLIVGNSNKRFSGVTSTMLQVLEHQTKLVSLAVLGKHHLPEGVRWLKYREMLKLCGRSTATGQHRVFHARRNDEMIQALIAKKLFGAKLRIAFTSTAQRHHSKFTKWLMRQMDSIISTCSSANRYLSPQADIIIPHGVDTRRYSPAANREAEWSELAYPGSKGIGIFGRIRPSKGTDLFVEATIQVLKRRNDVTAIICGETTAKYREFENQLKTKVAAANLEDRILFIGKQPFEKLPQLFRAMSVVVAASRNEGFGLTVLEAMASGTPVVATEAGAWKDIIQDHQHGYCVPCDDAAALEVAIDKLLDQDIESMGKNAREHIEQHYTTEREAEALTEHLLSLAKN